MKPFEQATTEELRALWEAQHKTPEIIPAEPLTNPLEIGEKFYTVWGQECSISFWDDDEDDHYRLKEKMIFPNSPEGKAGAELRSKVPHPGIHWQEDLRKLNEWWGSVDECRGGFKGFPLADFMEKYLNE